MPELDGISCLKEMIRINPDARIIIITALSDPDTGLEAVRSGARGYVTKPFTAEQLREEIAYVLESTSERR
ncbi:MAG: response regulator [Spirochaetes bacterium]|jgi:two-component system chemotaxis response regulator CheY|nr:response regulator [Spirochaetota bacterium]